MWPVERERPVFEGRPLQFPAWERWSCTKTDTESRSAAPPSTPSMTRAEMRREKEASVTEVRIESAQARRTASRKSILFFCCSAHAANCFPISRSSIDLDWRTVVVVLTLQKGLSIAQEIPSSFHRATKSWHFPRFSLWAGMLDHSQRVLIHFVIPV